MQAELFMLECMFCFNKMVRRCVGNMHHNEIGNSTLYGPKFVALLKFTNRLTSTASKTHRQVDGQLD